MSAISIEAIEHGLGAEAERRQVPGENSQHQVTDNPYDNLLRDLAHIRRMVEIKEARIEGLTGNWKGIYRRDLSDYKERTTAQLIDENPWLLDVVETVEKKR